MVASTFVYFVALEKITPGANYPNGSNTDFTVLI
jgi:hypothetical protein